MSDALATITDIEALLGRSLTPTESIRADAVLEKASALFRAAAEQEFTPGASTVWVNARGNRVSLAQQPVVSVESVQSPLGDKIDFTVRGNDVYLTSHASGQVRVQYTHGYSNVPDLVRLTVADIAQKVLTIPDAAQAGVQQRTETTGPFSETVTYATWALGGQATLAPDDRRIAESYRIRRAGTIRVSTVR